MNKINLNFKLESYINNNPIVIKFKNTTKKIKFKNEIKEIKIDSDSIFEDENNNITEQSSMNNQGTETVEHIDNTEKQKEVQEVYDIQKELEDKFDELFGTFDENNTTNEQ